MPPSCTALRLDVGRCTLKAIPIFNANTTRVTLAEAWPVVDDTLALERSSSGPRR